MSAWEKVTEFNPVTINWLISITNHLTFKIHIQVELSFTNLGVMVYSRLPSPSIKTIPRFSQVANFLTSAVLNNAPYVSWCEEEDSLYGISLCVMDLRKLVMENHDKFFFIIGEVFFDTSEKYQEQIENDYKAFGRGGRNAGPTPRRQKMELALTFDPI